MPILISHSSVTLSEPSKESVISNTTGPASASLLISMINGSSALVNSWFVPIPPNVVDPSVIVMPELFDPICPVTDESVLP